MIDHIKTIIKGNHEIWQDDIGPLPKFLERTHGNTNKMSAKRKAPWKPTKAMKSAAKKDSAKRKVEADRPLVLKAIKEGADTFGKIQKATSLEQKTIWKALRYYIKHRYILKSGRRYAAT